MMSGRILVEKGYARNQECRMIDLRVVVRPWAALHNLWSPGTLVRFVTDNGKILRGNSVIKKGGKKQRWYKKFLPPVGNTRLHDFGFKRHKATAIHMHAAYT